MFVACIFSMTSVKPVIKEAMSMTIEDHNKLFAFTNSWLLSITDGLLNSQHTSVARNLLECKEDLNLGACVVVAQGAMQNDISREKPCIEEKGNLHNQVQALSMLMRTLIMSENSPRDPATVAYAKVFAAHHGWAVRKTCSCCKNVCPLSKEQLLKKLNKDGEFLLLILE
ncbi:hypothetical protein ZIOFF_008973 [Zingiber officinale]|uniref:Glycolipid transfer protein domain-containing protein n=1 Tax=Zingiber officinale TaxID=94328 RepID=A0A8J5HG70_ZINOF|nr:hypothetical protein ZIOFF_008973 [Zingiber officinale]